MEEDFEKLVELSAMLLGRFGITDLEPVEDEEEITEDEWAARWAGVEGYCSSFNKFVYISMPQDVQDILAQMAHIVHENTEDRYSVEFTFDDEEEEG